MVLTHTWETGTQTKRLAELKDSVEVQAVRPRGAAAHCQTARRLGEGPPKASRVPSRMSVLGAIREAQQSNFQHQGLKMAIPGQRQVAVR
mmetsp:Transcript_14354/g.36171  ORF Transcript_14354/g.36171 Transcript_14354/m.36171 type:complete len:90 (+) Transcript_14354:326-595(+)